MSEILVITCPGGKQCSRLIPLLYNKGKFQLRLAAHSAQSAEKLKGLYPDAEVVTVDLQSLPECAKLLEGATAINAVLPSLHSHEKVMGFNLIDAAVIESRREGNVFKHFLFSSVLSTQHRTLLHHDLKSYVEEHLFLSPITCWTILKPVNFMDTFPLAKLVAQEKPVLDKWWSPNYASSLVSLKDLAEVSAKVLNERERHYLAEYPLCSTTPIAETEVVKLVEKRIGKQIEVRVPSLETGSDKLMEFLYGDKTGKTGNQGDPRGDLVRDTVERLILYYNRRGLQGSPNVMRWLLEREPTSVEQWIESVLSGSA
ncbi:putative nucleoside-diphosphate-sugar epimerase [Metarhizium acridum CQMa 102]|uniref:Putative nucleoside-diphosphate-sugar epimerase n=1 Tax=Metarhizium acridum (strain CQMa 102) TaxID=655827 RepID=E9E3V9_METAQ|nr:putative nucleoside-diphosphate-sugar epimerase [Metarhizium acridum CQMa 102]EFY89371.1 putative nucleoside-diphosphate-sugar epimerase [Metarhizium acridum CQMa 102]